MTLRWDVVLAILSMALVTFAVRAGGYAMLRAWKPPRFVDAMLNHMPGCIFVAFILPSVALQGAWHIAAACVAVLCMRLTRMLSLSIMLSVAALWLLRGTP
ncbi:MAG: AzlD domain-containing protein [Alphaproteobacteria bacterium]|nr:AzlD domain-containing protein [Alphaproteobacteria bacterium]